MKLRIKGNSLRLRVSPSEMRRLLDEGRIEETVHFAAADTAKLTYAIEHNPETSQMGFRSQPQEITVVISSQDARRWADGQDVGLYGQSESGSRILDLAIEKDFACLDKRPSDNGDTYPNPEDGIIC